MKLRVSPSYDLPSLQAACRPDLPLWVRGGTAALGHLAIARADEAITFGIDKAHAWYVDWCAERLGTYQRCLDSNPHLLQSPLHCGYISEDAGNPHTEYIHLVGMYPGFIVAIRRQCHDALVLDDDKLVAVRAGLHREVLVVRLRTVMVAITDAEGPEPIPCGEYADSRLIDANYYWSAHSR